MAGTVSCLCICDELDQQPKKAWRSSPLSVHSHAQRLRDRPRPLALPSRLDEPERGHERRRQQPQHAAQHKLEQLRRPAVIVDIVPAVALAQGRQRADSDRPKQDKGGHAEQEPSEGLMTDVGEFGGRGVVTEKEEPAEERAAGLREEGEGLDRAVGEVVGDEEPLDEPGEDTLDDDGDGAVAGEGVGELEEADGVPGCVLGGVHDWGG